MSTESTFRMTVPVELVRIVNGPPMIRVLGTQDKLIEQRSSAEEYRGVMLRFTLTTSASSRKFQQTIDVRSIELISDYAFGFRGYTGRQPIRGVYNPRTRTGHFEQGI